MLHLAVSASSRIPASSCPHLWSRSFLGSRSITGITSTSTTANNTLKAMAMSMDEGQRRFRQQYQEPKPGKEYLMNPLPQFSNPNYKPSGKLHGKVALVTGGDSGIGRSVSYHFTLEGATVAFTYVKGVEDIDANDTLKIINESRVKGSNDPIAIPTDLRYSKNCKDVVDEVISKYGRIDILVNNIGEVYPSLYSPTLEEITEERLENGFRTNIFSYIFMTRHALKHMKKGSAIINTASVSAYTGRLLVDYSSTKGAVVSFTRSLALYLIDQKIRVNGVAPGPVWTPLQVVGGQDIATFGSDVPMGRGAQPYELAPSYVFLASEQDSSYFTGQVLHPNGGFIVNG